MANQIHWFPGHMKKALNEITEKVKLVDVVIELLDARAPLASFNESFETLVANKKHLIILTKPDLADPNRTEYFKSELSKTYDMLLVLDLTSPKAGQEIAKAVNKLGEDKHKKDLSRGMKPQPIKTMIIGIPNVGKSSLINRLANRKAAGVQNKPGYTRGEQWIKVNNDFILLDTPGVLPMNYEDKEKAAKLALIGSIREEILPNNELVHKLLNYLKKHYPKALLSRFGIEEIQDDVLTLTEIAKVRGLLDSNGNYDLLKSETLLLKEFKDGKLGRVTLE